MKMVLRISAVCTLVLTLSHCADSGGGGSQQAGTGPFDRHGRYIEEWADNPSKWRKPGAAPSPHELKSDDLPEIAQSEQPPANANPLAPTKPAPVVSQTAVTPKPAAKPTTTTTSAKPKPKPVVKTKPKPKSVTYVVKKGDSLSVIASRTGSSVSAIKSANGISGTLIRPGQVLKIPKK